MSYDGSVARRAPDLAAAASSKLDQEHISAVFPAADGYLWIGTRKQGLFRFDGRSVIPSSRPNRLGTGWEVTTLLQDSSGILWIGTPSDLLLLEGAATSSFHGLPGVDVHQIMEDTYGHVWVSVGPALFRRVQEIFQSISIPLGLNSSFIFDLEMGPEGGLWIARESDLLRFGGDFEQAGLPQTHTRIEGIPRGAARKLVADSNGLWIGTHADGLFRWIAGELMPVNQVPIESEVTCLLVGRFGHLWVGTRAGLFKLDLLPASELSAAPSARITALIVQEELLPLALGSPAPRPLSPEESEVEARFAAASFRLDQEPVFRTQLEPLESEWRLLEKGDALRLPRLKPGEYELRVQASFDGETWGPTASQSLVRQARFYQTPKAWLWAAGTLLFLVLLWLARRMHRSHMERLHEEMIASELDQLGDGIRLEEWQASAGAGLVESRKSKPEQPG